MLDEDEFGNSHEGTLPKLSLVEKNVFAAVIVYTQQ